MDAFFEVKKTRRVFFFFLQKEIKQGMKLGDSGTLKLVVAFLPPPAHSPRLFFLKEHMVNKIKSLQHTQQDKASDHASVNFPLQGIFF